MKKSLVLAMAMALGVTASAYAANPFSDVPAGHWAYDSVNKLAAAGVIDGYGDATFGGDKLMTRYEMAQIVAKAMAKGANVDKLAAEFADELDTLGVRVANLEKKADNVKITGQARFRYQSHENGDDKGDLRSRLWIAGQVNDDWTYTAMLQNTQNFDNDNGDEKTEFLRAYVDGRIGGLQVHAGRWDEVTSTGAILDSYVDGVKVSYGDKVKVYGIAAKAADYDAIDGGLTYDEGDRLYVAGVEANVGVVNGYFNYFKADNAATDPKFDKDGALDKGKSAFDSKEIYNVGISLDVAKDLNLAYEYMWSDKKYNKKVSKDGFVATLAYKGADAEVANTWGVHASYYDQPINAILSPTYDATLFLDEGGYKGWSAGVDYTLAKNIQLCVNYYDTEAKIGNNDDQSVFTELFFFF
ncbi:S-layer homology domain-containing protein [uncultured Phascolarctobacterium sp.]|uniref:S-layer homology domain-containing protein n=1 Tax=uncultured Phascolarctobacterium sp. TaxID=512296 RepID=UPI0025D24005|nr:S-layer homology domain-containing protein [uncultured Phascolarctobacterium sp.]